MQEWRLGNLPVLNQGAHPMTDNTETAPLGSSAAQAHVKELIARGKTDYAVFELIDGLDPDTPHLAAIREPVVGVVQTNVREELKQGQAIRETAEKLLDLAEPADLFGAWQACVDAAAPDRKALKGLCEGFARIVEAVGREVLIESLELATEVLQNHGRSGVEMLAGALGRALAALPPDKRSAYREWLTPYIPSAYDKPFAGLARIAKVLVQHDETDLLEKLAEALPTKAFEEDVPPDKFAVKCGDGIDKVPVELQRQYARLGATIALQCCSSSAAVSAKLPAKLEQIDAAARGKYLDCFIRLVDCVGIRVHGFCLKPLHKAFAPTPSVAELDYVDLVCAEGKQYGSGAAAAFIEQRTQVSREAWLGVAQTS